MTQSLKRLPITNTIELKRSRVLSTVQRWSIIDEYSYHLNNTKIKLTSDDKDELRRWFNFICSLSSELLSIWKRLPKTFEISETFREEQMKGIYHANNMGDVLTMELIKIDRKIDAVNDKIERACRYIRTGNLQPDEIFLEQRNLTKLFDKIDYQRKEIREVYTDQGGLIFLKYFFNSIYFLVSVALYFYCIHETFFV